MLITEVYSEQKFACEMYSAPHRRTLCFLREGVRIMKKALSLLVVLSILLSILPATVSAAHWADADVAYLIENGAIAEDDAMLNNLDTPITRSQMVKVIVALLEGDEPEDGKEYFTDITLEDTHIAKAAANGYVNGFGDGTFRPNNPITRQDFFTIVGRAYELTGEATKEFTDADSIADYAKPYVDALQSIGIVNGYGDGTINPRGNITIAETLAVMHRTDEHIKANTPKEEKPKQTGGGGGFVSSNHGWPPGSRPPKEPTAMPTVTFDVEYTDDWSGGAVAYVTVDVDSTIDIKLKKILAITGSFTNHSAGGTWNKWDELIEHNQVLPEKNGRFAVPDFGRYELILVDEKNRFWDACSINIVPPESDDISPPVLTWELPEDTTLPYEVKVNATDDTQIARISHFCLPSILHSIIGAGEDQNAQDFKLHVNGRQNVTSDTLTVDGVCIVQAMDTAGNCSYVRLGGGVNSTNIMYSSEAAKDIPYMGPDAVSGLSQGVVFTIEREDSLSGEYIARVNANITFRNATINEKILIKDNIPYTTGAVGSVEYAWDVAKRAKLNILEEDGYYYLPDFGEYVMYMHYGDEWYVARFEVKAPYDGDMEAPQLTIEAVGEKTMPRTFAVKASDNTKIARINYVKRSGSITNRNISEYYSAHVHNRVAITEDTFTIDNVGGYIVCAMDTNGNCAYVPLFIDVDGEVSIGENSVSYGFDDGCPWIYHIFSTGNITSGPLAINLYIGDNDSGVVEAGYFVLPEHYQKHTNKYGSIQQKASLKVRYNLDLSQSLEDLAQYNAQCGGDDAICVLKNYYEATREGSGVEMVPIERDFISLKENGTYFIWARDAMGNLTVLRESVNNIKCPTVTLTAQSEGNVSAEGVGRITANIDINPNAPIKRMFAVKSGYTYGPEDPPHLKRTTNGKAIKVWEAVEKTGQYIPVKSMGFSVPDFGTYTLYVLDEYGNWGSGEVEVMSRYGGDDEAPELTLSVPDETTLPLTVTLTASDNVGVVRKSCVKVSDEYIKENASLNAKDCFETHISNRTLISNSFTIEEPGTYAVSVMDKSGNCDYAAITVNDLGEVNIF